MRKPKTYSILFLFVFLSYTISSCSVAQKKKERNLIGAWNVVNVLEMAAPTVQQWVFDTDGIVYILNITDSTSDVSDEGIWEMKQKINSATLSTVFGTVASEQAGISVEWEVHSLKKETMYLTHQEGGLLTKEFEKAD